MEVDMSTLTLDEPRLYIIMRKDIYDMNPGKLAAQAAHAGTKFVKKAFLNGENSKLMNSYLEWDDGRGFGTKITLAATKADIQETMDFMQDLDVTSGTVVDPTYPFRNYFGEMFTAEELTCAYVFAPRDVPQEALDYLRKFPLHP